MNSEKLKQLQIASEAKDRPKRSFRIILFAVLLITGAALYLAWPKKDDSRRLVNAPAESVASAPATSTPAKSETAPTPSTSVPATKNGDSVLTVSGYIINRERIELSPRFMTIVKWIGVKKGDAVTNGQVVALLDDSEYRARLLEAEARIATAQVAVAKAELNFNRIKQLRATQVETEQAEDDARLQLDGAHASLKEARAAHEVARTYLEWTTIRSPIDGVVLEKLVDPSELVVPQSFGGNRGPSTALIAVANPKDLQVEIDLNEADVAKVFLNQKCRVSPEAYPDKVYEGYVAEMAPEANRQKGTLQIKVQIRNPDHFLTPELSAKVDFLRNQ